MKVKAIVILVKADNDKIYQAYVTKEQQGYVEDLLSQVSKSGKIVILNKPITGIEISTPVGKKSK